MKRCSAEKQEGPATFLSFHFEKSGNDGRSTSGDTLRMGRCSPHTPRRSMSLGQQRDKMLGIRITISAKLSPGALRETHGDLPALLMYSRAPDYRPHVSSARRAAVG